MDKPQKIAVSIAVSGGRLCPKLPADIARRRARWDRIYGPQTFFFSMHEVAKEPSTYVEMLIYLCYLFSK